MSAKAYEALSKSNELTATNETAQSPKQNNDVDEKEMKKRKKAALIKFGSLAVFAFIVWIFATISWFSSNTSVSGNGMGVSVGTGDYELRVSGNNLGAKSYTQSGTGNNATYSNNSDILGFSSVFGKYTNGASGSSYDTDGANPSIKWRLTPEYTTKEDKGLGPGSEGVLTFSVVPKREGEINPSFSINLEGYVAPHQHKNENGSYRVDESDLQKITSSSGEAAQAGLSYLNGHILFFNHRDGAGTTSNPYTYTGLLNKNDFSLSDVLGSVQNGTPGTPIEVNIYWVWPNTFGQMVLTSNENNGRKSIITETNAGIATLNAVQSYVLDNVPNLLDLSVFNYPEGVTTNAEKTNSIKLKMATSTGAEDNITYSFASQKAISNLNDLSSGYNNADQKIGTNINYVLISLQTVQ
ncbi:MAG: hypothetical protein IKW87_12780 [Ruminococcus sp.]|nr:hypothetical protein [Ruminococcus sp.]